MKSLIRLVACFTLATLAVLLAAQLNAQGKPQANDSDSDAAERPVPQAALLTERGRQLAEELKLLRRSRDSMGARHPTLPIINKKIEAIEEQLKAWEPAPNPFRTEEQPPQMNDYDLRQVVIKLTKRVEELEKRVKRLEAGL